MRTTLLAVSLAAGLSATASADRRTILLTGYWPPTNEMLRPFSQDPVQNPDGWVGGNWEERGYDVVAFFPEFPGGTWPIGEGDFTVDYQDTSTDWWSIVPERRPVAIITFSRGFSDNSWELEMNQFNRQTWVGDYEAPTQPTPAPPDDSIPAGTLRESTLPVDDILAAVDEQVPEVNAYICYTQDGGGFLSEFIGYHGVWYQSIHAPGNTPTPCWASGHIHVGNGNSVPVARDAAEVTVRALIAWLDENLPPYEDITGDGVVNVNDLITLLANFGPCSLGLPCPYDLDCSGAVDVGDLIMILGAWSR